jgi:hypothetical protein
MKSPSSAHFNRSTKKTLLTAEELDIIQIILTEITPKTHQRSQILRFEVLMVVKMLMLVFWVATQWVCKKIPTFWRNILPSLVSTYKSTWCYNSE